MTMRETYETEALEAMIENARMAAERSADLAVQSQQDVELGHAMLARSSRVLERSVQLLANDIFRGQI